MVDEINYDTKENIENTFNKIVELNIILENF